MLIKPSDMNNVINAGGGGASMVYAADGASYFMVAVMPTAASGADVFGTYDNFNKFAAADGKEPLSERAVFYGVLLQRDSKLDKLPSDWQTSVTLFDLPRGAGASLANLFADEDLCLNLLYLDEAGKVKTETTDENGETVPVPAPSVIKLTRDASKQASQMYALTPLPQQASVYSLIKDEYTMPSETLPEAITRLNGYAAKDLKNWNQYGSVEAPTEPENPAPTPSTEPENPAPAPNTISDAIAAKLASGEPLDAAALAAILNSTN
jgi:hypothetical protein